jgi:hypothetical protein
MPEPLRLLGAACDTDTQCATGSCAKGDALAGGYCSVQNCGSKTPCPAGSTCYALSPSVSMCMAYCDGAAACRSADGYRCQQLFPSDVKVCAPACSASGACASGTRCNPKSGLCELAECDAGSTSNVCATEETCQRDVTGLSNQSGLCLKSCNPTAVTPCLASKGEICQPLGSDPAHGFCSQPRCKTSEDCPSDAVCAQGICKPPQFCNATVACSDFATTCVFGKCMPRCPSGAGCAGIHSGLECASTLDVPACMPVGSFPGSACRPTPDDECDAIAAGSQTADMLCERGTCAPDCAAGGEALCQAIEPNLVCAYGVVGTPVCLAKGSFPGSACDDANACAQNLDGNSAVDLVCKGGKCAISCAETGKWPGYGDALCQFVDSTATCSDKHGSVCVRACGPAPARTCDAGYACFEPGAMPGHEDACLPAGSFPGSPCRPTPNDTCDQNLHGDPAADMICRLGICVLPCAGNNDALCHGVDPALTCVEAVSTGSICVTACGAGGACDPGYSCLDAGDSTHQNACLVTGSYAGSVCRPTGSAILCDQDLLGDLTHDLVCTSAGTCALSCPNNDDDLCTAIDPALTCSESSGSTCVPDCMAGACPSGLTCHDPGTHPEHENSCLVP